MLVLRSLLNPISKRGVGGHWEDLRSGLHPYSLGTDGPGRSNIEIRFDVCLSRVLSRVVTFLFSLLSLVHKSIPTPIHVSLIFFTAVVLCTKLIKFLSFSSVRTIKSPLWSNSYLF